MLAEIRYADAPKESAEPTEILDTAVLIRVTQQVANQINRKTKQNKIYKYV